MMTRSHRRPLLTGLPRSIWRWRADEAYLQAFRGQRGAPRILAEVLLLMKLGRGHRARPAAEDAGW
jgi:hypothetical protein